MARTTEVTALGSDTARVWWVGDQEVFGTAGKQRECLAPVSMAFWGRVL